MNATASILPSEAPAPDLPKPVLFHPLKHHLLYIRSFITENAATPEAMLKAALRTIGSSSQLDFYTGLLSPWQIAQESILYLQQKDLLAPEAYRLYLAACGTDYRVVSLSDGTDWVLRWGVVAGRHVHLHPARYAANTTRIKANILKTAVATLLLAQRQGKKEADLQLINQARAQWLGLAPLKEYHAEEGLGKLIQQLQQP